jgi:azurin
MNAPFREVNAQRLEQAVHSARETAARFLGALALLPVLTACLTPGAAQQTVVKAVVRAKPVEAIATIAPTVAPTPSAVPAPTTAPAPTVAAAPIATPLANQQAISLGTNGGEWQFNVDTLEAAAVKSIVLTFNNGAKTTAHNWLLITGDDNTATEINAAGEQAGAAAAYIPDDPRIIARTAGLVKGGQSESVTFDAPAAGTYVYLCTFPGHLDLGMKGVLTVK